MKLQFEERSAAPYSLVCIHFFSIQANNSYPSIFQNTSAALKFKNRLASGTWTQRV